MGGLTSKQFEAIANEDQSQPATPQAAPLRKLSPVFDPRSPTTEISRTPIHVEQTPKPARPLIDPRSPTDEITRTPIYGVDKSSETDASVTPVRGSVEREAKSLPRATLSYDDSIEGIESTALAKDTATEYESSTEVFTDDGSEAKLIRGPEKTATGSQKDTTKAKPALVFQNNSNMSPKLERSPLSVISDSSRRRDVNSPLAIVQRKQASKINKASKMNNGVNSPVKYKMIIHDDKENRS